ncbi:hypothetical protein Gogos_010936 [Gossypium gossypioides]|uniref:Uncharacterized protein n=1 Tax=Gossypium gossypioides TaxID=34282 RepID=A0A7J9BN06_GOSGO|nr:hypothetical protein [Gossypium gossypioides]
MCTSPATETSFETEKNSDNSESSNSTINGESSTFEPWMVVERRARQGQRDQRNQREGALEKTSLGSRFSTLNGLDNTKISAGDRDGMISDDSFAKLKGKENFDARIMGKGNTYLNIVAKDLGNRQFKVGDPKGNGSGLNTDGFSMLGNVIGENVGPRMKVGTARVPFFESMNSLVELINAQLVTGRSKETETSEGLQELESGDSK